MTKYSISMPYRGNDIYEIEFDGTKQELIDLLEEDFSVDDLVGLGKARILYIAKDKRLGDIEVS